MKRNAKTRSPQPVAIAACVADLNPIALNEIRMFPAGEFRARDGRPFEVPAWRIDAVIAARVIARAEAAKDDWVIDYEHQTLSTEKNGQPAPAAGWGKKLEWRDDGLYAVALRWNERARAAIAAGEYRYVSPVFEYDQKTGEVLAIRMAALTNFAGIDGLDDLNARAAAKFQSDVPAQENDHMKREDLIKLLGLNADATDDVIDAALAALKAKADTLQETRNFLGVKDGESISSALAALKAKPATPDPAKFVSIDAHKQVVDDLAALRSDLDARDLQAVITTAIDEGRLATAEEQWARDFHKAHGLVALRESLAKRPVIAALKGTQTGGKPPEKKDGELDEAQLAVCRAMGLSEEDFKKNAQAA